MGAARLVTLHLPQQTLKHTGLLAETCGHTAAAITRTCEPGRGQSAPTAPATAGIS